MARKKRAERQSQGVNEDRKKSVRSIVSVAVIAALVFVIVAMIASQYFDIPLLSVPKTLVSKIITPVQAQFSAGTDGVVGYLRKLKLRSNLEYEYEQLLAKLDELTNEAMLANEYKLELEAYKDLTQELTQRAALDGVIASVIGKDTGNYFSVLTINVGTDNGVQENMAVITPGALIGYTYDVEATSCKVRTIIDTQTKIAAILETSRDQGSIQGTLGLDGTAMCRMYYLPENTLPRPGELVVTSGVGMQFPKGIPIGYVRESTRGMEDNKSYVVVEPKADFQHIEYVIVYRYIPSYAESADARDAEVDPTFLPLYTPRPVPTWEPGSAGAPDVTDTATPPPDGAGNENATVTPPPEDTQTPPPATDDPNATPRPENLSYQDALTTDTPVPTDTPEPTPSPTPTMEPFIIEEDE